MLDLSICIASLNASAYPEQCLQSIREQSSSLPWARVSQPMPQSPAGEASHTLGLLGGKLVLSLDAKALRTDKYAGSHRP